MKKLFAMILSIALLLSVPAASASSLDSWFARTDPCLVTEFEGLAMYRFMCNYQKIDSVLDLHPVYSQLIPYSDLPFLDSYFGSIEVDENNFIKSIVMLIEPNSNSEKFLQRAYSCISAISALEFDGAGDNRMEIAFKAGLSDYSSSFYAAMDIYTQKILPNITNILNKSPRENTEFSVYSGFFNYYVSFTSISGTQKIYLTARAK